MEATNVDVAEIFDVRDKFKNAHIDEKTYREMYNRSIEDPAGFWSEMARRELLWDREWETALRWDYHKGEISWFLGGKINVSKNCIDRHLERRADEVAIIWEGNEPGETRRLTYRELHRDVCRMANVLRRNGITTGDRVAIYMPMVPELAIAMLACARIGAIHSVIFAGFSAASIRGRVLDCAAKLVITANQGLRGNKRIALKEIVDEALETVDCVERVLVYRRTTAECPMKSGRDRWLDDELAGAGDDCEPVPLDSEHPLFILYTSGSTGQPKGVLHTQGGYLLYAALTHKYVFDYHEGDIYFCAADIGWVTGHSYIVYGPLANGATTLMFESTPTYPDAGRYWDVIERHRVNIFYTAPTAIRAVAKEGDKFVDQYDLSSLRVLGSVGEPINRDAWLWYFHRVGKGRCAVVDTWWQTETGGILIAPLPGATLLKPGAATLPFFGIQPAVVDQDGHELTGNAVKGRLCIKHPWPGQMRTIYNDHPRFLSTYLRQVPGTYFTGDGCVRDSDGFYWITGRVDDVLNVSGHRLGTAEVESAIVQSQVVVEAAVVGMPHEIKGIGIYAFCILHDGVSPDDDAKNRVIAAVRKAIGPLAVPDVIQFVPGLPKTRSGKIMRRILRKVAAGDTADLGDTTTLADPQILTELLKVPSTFFR